MNNVYVITRRIPGAERARNYTFEVSSSVKCTSHSGECFESEDAARDALAEWVVNNYLDWLVMDDENGDEKAEAEIKRTGFFEDGDGNRFCVEEKDFEKYFDCGPDGANDPRGFFVIR